MNSQTTILWLSGIVFATALLGMAGYSEAQNQPGSSDLRVPSGFQAELIYAVPAEQGSWVNLTTDPSGRLITSDQYGKLYRLTMNKNTADSPLVEPIEVKIGRAQGLLYAFDSLYVVAHGGDNMPPGLFRVRDTDNDDQFDSVEMLRQFEGGGEHGPHAVILSPDKQSLYICAGNNTALPHPESSRVPRVWQEDQLLPRLPDANGHNVGVNAPGGWVCKTDPDGSSFELICMGFRNEYDIAFDPNGELFTYDADMEWDFGLPWYRPTRVCHVVPGGEFGWRNGSGKWPDFYPDSLPSVIDIGPGSPTGITFGTGAKFPAKYQRALFISDWSYGVIYAVSLEPNGSTYNGTSERFCAAPALPVTDLVVNPSDGAMYFLIGGRGSQSAVYRISYIGSDSTEHVEIRPLNELAKYRRDLESHPKDLEKAWKSLNHPDRFIRFEARTNLELTPLKDWQARALGADLDEPQVILESAMALARAGGDQGSDIQDAIVAKLNSLAWSSLTLPQRHHLLRNYGLILMRMGKPTDSTQAAISALTKYFPVQSEIDGSESLNRELSRLLVANGSPLATLETLKLLKDAESQEQQIHFAMVLSVANSGWTPEAYEQYFQWFIDAASLQGGNSFLGYLKNIRARAVEAMPAEVRSQLSSLIAAELESKDPYADLKARPFVKNWSMENLSALESEDFTKRDLANGKKMFGVAQCYKCHRIQGQGGIAGPDLTPAGHRFSTHDLLETIVDPNKSISDQYQATIFQLVDGRTITGRVVNLNGDQYWVQPDMIKPNQLERINVDKIEAMKPSAISVMPAGLLDTLNQEEIADLIAYLKSTAPLPADGGSD